MRYFTLLFIVLIIGCTRPSKHPYVPLVLKAGDYWVNVYNKLQINGTAIVYKGEKLYCSTYMTNANDHEIFYCLDLKSGKVLWANPVNGHATYNPIVLNDVVYYVTYTGRRYGYDTLGNQIWSKGSIANNIVYSPTLHVYNAINHNLIIGDIMGHFNEFDKRTGEVSRAYLNKNEETNTVLPAYMDKYIYFVIKSDSAGKAHTIGKYWPLLVCRNTLTNKDVWQKSNFKCFGLYVKNGALYALAPHSIYSFNAINGTLKWRTDSTRLKMLRSDYLATFLSDRVLLKNNESFRDSVYLALNYATGETMQYRTTSKVFNYMFRDDSRHDLYFVKITVGSPNSQNSFEEGTDVEVKRQ